VRVDILERLADLIRPALSWREASPGTKPAGAFDGRGFVVTQAMTSLTGSAGEDFCVDPARARLSHGEAPGAAAEAGGGRNGYRGAGLDRSRARDASRGDAGRSDAS